ncbi:glycoside hydrolase [Auricularia subglabra TFB-10046 SS5]|nr:glycoside hydrolase [Auricularia subglabra TFB-10046 SS5]
MLTVALALALLVLLSDASPVGRQRFDPFATLAVQPSSLPTAANAAGPVLDQHAPFQRYASAESQEGTPGRRPTAEKYGPGSRVASLNSVKPNTQPDRQHAGTLLAQNSPLVAAYYPDWGADVLKPEQVDFDRLDWIDFAFVIPNSAYGVDFSDSSSKDLLARLVAAAHAKNKFVKLSIGGWDGSKHFSDAVSNEKNRKTFVSNIVTVFNQYQLDGIDIDWEYPGEMGQDGNIVSSQDAANFLTFLQMLRATLPSTAVISAACQVWPFADNNGNPLTEASAFASVLDWILIMNYDTWGSSANPGPNAPLSDGCRNSSQPFANAQAAVTSWTKSGFPAAQIVLGIPSYAYISQSTATHLSGRRRRHEPSQAAFDAQPDVTRGMMELAAQNDAAAPSAEVAPLKIVNEDGGSNGGQVQFRGLIEQGALKVTPDGRYVGTRGFKRVWDECSSTPFLRSEKAQQVITYDDPQSINLKAAFALEAGLLGVNMFDAHGDTATWALIDAARSGLGFVQ